MFGSVPSPMNRLFDVTGTTSIARWCWTVDANVGTTDVTCERTDGGDEPVALIGWLTRMAEQSLPIGQGYVGDITRVRWCYARDFTGSSGSRRDVTFDSKIVSVSPRRITACRRYTNDLDVHRVRRP